MDIGKLIYDRRTQLGLTLEEVGNMVGVSKSTVKKWESGDISNMRRDKIAALAKALKINPVDLVLEESTTTPEDDELQEYLEELKSRPEMKMLFKTLRGTTKEDIEKTVRIIEALKEQSE